MSRFLCEFRCTCGHIVNKMIKLKLNEYKQVFYTQRVYREKKAFPNQLSNILHRRFTLYLERNETLSLRCCHNYYLYTPDDDKMSAARELNLSEKKMSCDSEAAV